MSSTSHKGSLISLSVGALGVVFGDIGTSPLYALRESLAGEHSLTVDEGSVLGVLSLMFWSLIIIVTVKYLLIVMRADNHGEGGILALVSLVGGRPATRRVLLLLGLFGTALLYGDGMITPAISVLSAVEGIEIVAPSVSPLVLPIVVVILIGLFSIQHRGTEVIGRLFGPVMAVWFAVIAVLGLGEVLAHPSVLRALSPQYGVTFFGDQGFEGYLVLGSVFLVATGGEALYADMGHFGRHPIQLGWFTVVLPALVLNYFGQGARLLDDPSAIENPFLLLAPEWGRLPLTVLATMATVIASQALISGAFSLTAQAINLDYLPRMRVVQTSSHHRGQIYVPAINWFLLIACLALVVTFRSSANLAAAYGVAVTLTMAITTILIGAVAKQRWGWSLPVVIAVLLPLLIVDLAFLGANLFKIPAGGWVPLLIGFVGFGIFTTWRIGRQTVSERIERTALGIDEFVSSLSKRPPSRHPGTGVYLHRGAGLVPPALLANLRYNHSLHEVVVLLSVVTDDRPHVLVTERDHLVAHGLGFFELEMRYGFVEEPDVGADLKNLIFDGVSFDPDHTTFFLGRERIGIKGEPNLRTWRQHLFGFMLRNAGDPSSYFGLPSKRCVDLGTHVDI